MSFDKVLPKLKKRRVGGHIGAGNAAFSWIVVHEDALGDGDDHFWEKRRLFLSFYKLLFLAKQLHFFLSLINYYEPFSKNQIMNLKS